MSTRNAKYHYCDGCAQYKPISMCRSCEKKREAKVAGVRLPKADLVFAVENAHDPNCGSPPCLVHCRGDADYVGFFMNSHAEQFTLSVNRKVGVGTLRGGDLDWGNKVAIFDDTLRGGVILGEDEWKWLRTCWRAAVGRELKCAFHELKSEMILAASLAEEEGEKP